MGLMCKEANTSEIMEIKKSGLYGVELDTDLYTLAITNMIIRKDGKSNIVCGDCFSQEIYDNLKNKHLSLGLINPPYSQEDKCELDFVERLLDILEPRGLAVAVVPMSCAIGTKFKEVRERLFKYHTLKAVFSMPDDIFYPTGTNVCVMVWEAHKSHDSSKPTYFGYCKDDGFVKRKKMGRVDYYNRWDDIEKEWLDLYENKKVVDGKSALQCVTHEDEWLCEAYMKTDYTILTKQNFQTSINNYLSYLVKYSYTTLELRFENFLFKNDLNVDEWQEFKLSEIFNMEHGRRLTKEDREIGCIPFVTAGYENYGVVAHISNSEQKTYSNAITIDMFGNSFYYENQFKCDDNILILQNDKLNKYNALFITTIITIDKYKNSYGRQYRQKDYNNHKIKLPTKNNQIDWQYMEDYIKCLQYADRI